MEKRMCSITGCIFVISKKRKTVIRKLGKAWARELQHRETMRRTF